MSSNVLITIRIIFLRDKQNMKNFKLHRILIDFKLSDKPLIDSLASSKMPFASLGGLIFS